MLVKEEFGFLYNCLSMFNNTFIYYYINLMHNIKIKFLPVININMAKRKMIVIGPSEKRKTNQIILTRIKLVQVDTNNKTTNY